MVIAIFFAKTGLWIPGHECTGTLPVDYFSNFDDYYNKADWYYTLQEAKEACRLGCDASEDCHYADLYYRRWNYRGEVHWINQRCQLYSHHCHIIKFMPQLNLDEDMHLYNKGSYMLLSIL